MIAGNGADGIVLFDVATRRNSFVRNSIRDNGGSGIRLFAGSNDGLLPPTIHSAVLGPAGNPGGTGVSVTPPGTGANSFRIEFFANPPGEDEGRFFVGMSDLAGGAAHSVSLAAAVPKDYLLTATATDVNGNTSEISATRIVQINTDTDGDGIPDVYESANGLNPNLNDAALDKDGDGLTNAQEFRAGSDPQSGASRFHISAVTRSGSDLGLTFTSFAGKTYRIEFRDDLLTPTWTLLVGQVVATSGSTSIADPGAIAMPDRYYRAALEP